MAAVLQSARHTFPRLRRYLHPSAALRLSEILVWSGLVRLLLTVRTTEQTLRVLDALPRLHVGMPTPLPPERPFRLAGACLGRSLARSQYLRTRGHPHELVIGVKGDLATFAAHAWLDGDPVASDFVELRRIAR